MQRKLYTRTASPSITVCSRPSFNRMAWSVLCIVALTSLMVTSSSGYSSGAPRDVCISMFPHHGSEPQTSSSPYSIALGSQVYNPGNNQAITVTVTSLNTAFRGLMVQARSVSDCNQTVGSFQLDSSDTTLKLISCSAANDVVTHVDPNAKTTKAFSWMPPASGMGHVYIRATIVQSQNVFWNTVQSPIIYQGSNDATTTISCAPPSTMAAAEKLDAPHDNDGDSHEHNGNDDDDDGSRGASLTCSLVLATSLLFLSVIMMR